MIDRELQEEYRKRLIDRYTAAELVEILNLTPEDILDAFEEEWMNSEELLEEIGVENCEFNEIEEDDDYEEEE
jgi:hypothetical protein